MIRSWWMRGILIVLLVLNGAMLVPFLVRARFDRAEDWTDALLALANAAAVAGLAGKTRTGWFVAFGFVGMAGLRQAWANLGNGPAGLWLALGVAAAVFCVTDPALRRDHGIAA